MLTEKQRIYGRVSWYDRNSNYNNYFDNLSTGEWFKFVSRQFALDHVYVLTPTTVMNVRYGYNWFVRGTNSNPENHGFDLTWLGFPASYNASIPDDIRRFPRFDITGYQGTGIGGEERPNETQSFIATITKTTGAHSIADRHGIAAVSRDQRRCSPTTRPASSTSTRPGRAARSTTRRRAGHARPVVRRVPARPADARGFVTRAAGYDEKSQNWGFFVQDDWRVSERLTVNLGLRYEFETPLTEANNHSVRGFDFAAVQAIEAAARARYAHEPDAEVPVSEFNVRGGLTFAGVNGEPEGLYDTPKNNFMPRVGLAYKIDDKTVLAAGYGMFYGFLGQRRGDVIQSGFSQQHQPDPDARQRPDVHRARCRTRSRTASRSRSAPRAASRRSSARASPSSIRTRSRRGCSGGRSACSASSAAAGWPKPATSATTARSCRRPATSTRRRTST